MFLVLNLTQVEVKANRNLLHMLATTIQELVHDFYSVTDILATTNRIFLTLHSSHAELRVPGSRVMRLQFNMNNLLQHLDILGSQMITPN